MNKFSINKDVKSIVMPNTINKRFFCMEYDQDDGNI